MKNAIVIINLAIFCEYNFLMPYWHEDLKKSYINMSCPRYRFYDCRHEVSSLAFLILSGRSQKQVYKWYEERRMFHVPSATSPVSVL